LTYSFGQTTVPHFSLFCSSIIILPTSIKGEATLTGEILADQCTLVGTRILSNAISQRLLNADGLAMLLRTLRGILFPNNLAGKSTLVAPTSEAELQALRRRCASAIWALVPLPVGRVYFGLSGGFWSRSASSSSSSHPRSAPQAHHAGGQQRRSKADKGATAEGAAPDGRKGDASTRADSPVMTRARPEEAGGGGEEAAATEEVRILTDIETGLLDVFGDAYCNKHLVYSILELVLVRLMPEMADKSVTELWEERLS
jgi:hypothetical protein